MYFSFLLNLFCIKWFWFIFLFYHITYCMNISFEIVLRTLIVFSNRKHIYWRSTLVNLFQEKTKHLRFVIFLMFLMSICVVEIHLIRVAHLFFSKVQLSQGQVIFSSRQKITEYQHCNSPVRFLKLKNNWFVHFSILRFQLFMTISG